jgi:Flp pilus assembly pilin Flp
MVAAIAAIIIGTVVTLGGKVHQAFIDTNTAMP